MAATGALVLVAAVPPARLVGLAVDLLPEVLGAPAGFAAPLVDVEA